MYQYFNRKKVILFVWIGCFTLCLNAQTQQGYIIKIEGEKIYLDLHIPDVKTADVVTVYREGGYITHPVTNQRIKTEDERIGRIEITQAFDSYSVGKMVSGAANILKEGMSVKKEQKVEIPEMNQPKRQPETTSTFRSGDGSKPPVVIVPAYVNDVVGSTGYFGGYVADMLMEQLLRGDQVRLLDRTVLDAQMDELALVGSYIDPETAIQRGKIIGARYVIQVNMQKPDVVNVRTGIPLVSMMGAAQAISGQNLYAQYASNTQTGTLKAEVRISSRVIDLETGEIIFLSSATGKAKGKSQLGMEYGALGGLQLNGGAQGFGQTITGKAVQSAFVPIGRNLNGYFSGKIDKKVVSSSGGGAGYGDELRLRNSSLYLGVEKLDKEGAQMTFENNPDWYLRYLKAKRNVGWSIPLMIIGGGGAAFGILVQADMFTDEWKTNGKILITVAGGGTFATGVILRKNGLAQLRSIASEYNAQNSSNQASLSFVTTGNGLGLRLTF